uniref:Eukaryotic translation initiation factor 3 subunit L n=3 Tax=Lygus hesperus TaxID=30085 RepID=A0A0A9Y4I3_LYGHE
MYSGVYDDYEGSYDRGGYNDYDYEPHSGDPQADLEYDHRMHSGYARIPDTVKNFLAFLCNAINEGQLFDIQNLYENTFPKLTEQFYDKTPWPEEAEVKQVVGEDQVFLILYKELYFRHLYARCPNNLNLQQRFNSFSNYCDLLNCILSGDRPVNLVLPDQWLWELIDEFIYQFQSFSQYRARVAKRSREEIQELTNNYKYWNVLCVLNVLHSLVDKSNIKKQLEVYASGGDPDSVAGEYGRHSLYKMLGYFSLVALLRLHSLLGDYYQAIKVLENIEIHKKSQYSHVPACQISTSYYVGFAYMMMRRYSDAIRTFSSILLYIQRTKQLFQTRTYQNDQINKQTEQMYHLLAICLVLHPQCIDDSIQQHLREKNYHEKMFKMQCGDLSEFEACFQFACPKFLLAHPPSLTGTAPAEADYMKDATKHQTEVFMDEVKQQKMLPTIRSYLKLYTTLPLYKLATFMNPSSLATEKDCAALRTHLLCFKHKMKNVVWTKGTSGLEGSFQSGSELDFYIDHDMIHIADTKVANRYGDFFIRKILKFEELNHKLHSIKL